MALNVRFGNPHSPHVAVDKYKKMYADQSDGAAHFYGEVTAMDAALGELRKRVNGFVPLLDCILNAAERVNS